MADLERNASQTINEDTTKCEFSIAELEGLPQDVIDRLGKPEGKEETHRYLTMKYPDVIPALKLVKNEEVRKTLDLTRGK